MPPETRGASSARVAWAPIVVAAALVAALAAIALWLERGARPERVGPRFVAALNARHAGAQVRPLDGGVVRVTLPDGGAIDVRLAGVFDTCARRRMDCDAALLGAAADVDAVAALTTAPRRDALRPLVVAEMPGYRYGYLATPLAGVLERRVALVAGVASTTVTAGLAGRLGLAPDALDAAALANLRAEPAPALEPVVEGDTTIWRVHGAEPAAFLVDDVAMRRFATTLVTRRLYAVAPTRGTLAIGPANDATARALDALRTRLRAGRSATNDSGLLLYDLDAPADRRLSIARRP